MTGRTYRIRSVPAAAAMGVALLSTAGFLETLRIFGAGSWPKELAVRFYLELVRAHCKLLGLDVTTLGACPTCGVPDRTLVCPECGKPHRMGSLAHAEAGSYLDERFMHQFVAFCPDCHARDRGATK